MRRYPSISPAPFQSGDSIYFQFEDLVYLKGAYLQFTSDVAAKDLKITINRVMFIKILEGEKSLIVNDCLFANELGDLCFVQKDNQVHFNTGLFEVDDVIALKGRLQLCVQLGDIGEHRLLKCDLKTYDAQSVGNFQISFMSWTNCNVIDHPPEKAFEMGEQIKFLAGRGAIPLSLKPIKRIFTKLPCVLNTNGVDVELQSGLSPIADLKHSAIIEWNPEDSNLVFVNHKQELDFSE